MIDLDPAVLSLQSSRHVEQAAEIAAEQRGGLGFGDALHLVRHHALGDFRILDAEGAAEAAADLAFVHFLQGETVHRGEQRSGLRFDPHFP